MKILIIDFETTGLNIKADDFSALEFAYSYSEDLNLISCGSFLIKQESRNIVEWEGNNITNELLINATKTFTEAQNFIEHLISKSDVIIAWNGKGFDFKVIEEYFNISMINTNPNIVAVDPIYHCEEVMCKKVKGLDECSHYFRTDVKPSHRAIYDVLTVFEILRQIDIKKAIENATEPLYRILVNFTRGDTRFEEKKEFIKKTFNAQWSKPVQGYWNITVKKRELENVKKTLKENDINFKEEELIKF